MAQIDNRLKTAVQIFKRLNIGAEMGARYLLRRTKEFLGTARRSGRQYPVPGAPGAKRRAGSNSTGKAVQYRARRGGGFRRVYTASAPGEPPANRTGNMRKALRVSRAQRVGGRITVNVGANVRRGDQAFNYARYHEFNNQRSYLIRTFRNPEVKRGMVRQILAALKSK